MTLHRVFTWDGSTDGDVAGGPLFVPRRRQGSGRHDNPELYGAFYCSLEPASCIAEALQPFRNQSVAQSDLSRSDGLCLALARYDLGVDADLADLDDPLALHCRGLRPSQVATLERQLTQRTAARIYEEGAAGLLWWSVLESLWINATLFLERVRENLATADRPVVLSVDDPRVVAVAGKLGIRLG